MEPFLQLLDVVRENFSDAAFRRGAISAFVIVLLYVWVRNALTVRRAKAARRTPGELAAQLGRMDARVDQRVAEIVETDAGLREQWAATQQQLAEAQEHARSAQIAKGLLLEQVARRDREVARLLALREVQGGPNLAIRTVHDLGEPHLSALTSGAEAWAEYRRSQDRPLSLVGLDLTDADLSGYDLSGCELYRAVLIGAKLDGANLTGADMVSTTCVGASFVDADLSGAQLTRADLSHADLSGAVLTGADLSRACLVGANIASAKPAGARLSNTLMPDGTIVSGYVADSEPVSAAQTVQP